MAQLIMQISLIAFECATERIDDAAAQKHSMVEISEFPYFDKKVS